MTIPQSNKLPNWIKWLAQDKDGCWWGYSVEPLEHDKGWYENEVGQYILIQKDVENKNWKKTLTKIDPNTTSS